VAQLKDKVKTSFSETRNVVLGAQILLGFQYNAVFRPGFDHLSPTARWTEAVALGLLLTAMLLLLAPTSFHHIAQRGEATARQLRFNKLLIGWALLPFALALGANLFMATERPLGAATAVTLGAAGSAVALVSWFGIELMHAAKRHGRERDGGSPAEEPTPLKDKINQILEESRIVLPGAQALLGFQLAAYLTDAFDRLPEGSKLVHTASLLLIALAVILLMTPAPLHRIVYDGEEDPDFNRAATRLVLAAMLPLALGLAGELYVVLARIGGDTLGIVTAVAAALAFLGAWFGYPLLARRGA
jgi:hypothetical protein